jgi:hypothetical protein
MAAVQHLAARWQQLLPMSKAFLRLRSASPSPYKDFTGSCTAVQKTQAPRFPAEGQPSVLSALPFCCTYRYIHRSLPAYQPVFPEPPSPRAISHWQQLLHICCNLLPLLPTSGPPAGPADLKPADPIRNGVVEANREVSLPESRAGLPGVCPGARSPNY